MGTTRCCIWVSLNIKTYVWTLLLPSVLSFFLSEFHFILHVLFFSQFGNTCYCNSVLQALYFCRPFREKVLAYKVRTPAVLLSAGCFECAHDCSLIHWNKLILRLKWLFFQLVTKFIYERILHYGQISTEMVVFLSVYNISPIKLKRSEA